jgi:hypothetical protein
MMVFRPAAMVEAWVMNNGSEALFKALYVAIAGPGKSLQRQGTILRSIGRVSHDSSGSE